MEVILLGTGAADGWPNAFCSCATCAELRARGEVHCPTAALVDRRVMLDAGPMVEAAAQRFGADLAGVRTVLVTHAHSDHLAPAFLLHRSWIDQQPLRIYGPAPVIEACTHWLAPGQDTVTLHPVTAGDDIDVDGYRVTVLAADHEAFGEAVLYRISDGKASLLYATDTGGWPPSTLGRLAGCRLDLVLLEETFGDRLPAGGHHNLETFTQAVAALRELGAVTDQTQVVAVHLSHHNPVTSTLRARLGRIGARPGMDGEVIALG